MSRLDHFNIKQNCSSIKMSQNKLLLCWQILFYLMEVEDKCSSRNRLCIEKAIEKRGLK